VLVASVVNAQQIQLALEASRTTGVAPLAVFFDATATTHLDPVVRPFHDLGFEWDFDDPTAGVWTESGKDKSWATGAVAAHVFETPGTYTVTVTAQDAAGEEAFESVGITVLDPDSAGWTTYYVSSSAGNDLNTGLSPGAPFETLPRAFSEQGANRRILLKRGDEWTISQGLEVSAAGPGLIASYDSGPPPRIVSAAPGPDCYGVRVNASDWRLADLDLERNDGAYQCAAILAGPGVANVLALRNQASGFEVGLQSEWSTTSDGLFFVENQVEDIDVNGAYLGSNRLAILGNRIGQILLSHVLRVWYARKGVIASNTLYDPSTTSTLNRLALKFHTDVALSSDPAELVVIADNTFRGDGRVSTFAPQDDWSDEEVRNLVIERNHIVSTEDTAASILIEGHDITVRNNVISGSNGSQYYTGVLIRHPADLTTPVSDLDFFHNVVTRGDTVSGYSEYTAFNIGPNVERLRFRNNILHKIQPVDWNYVFMVEEAATVSEIDSDLNLMSLASSQFANVAGVDYGLAAWRSAFGQDLDSWEVADVGFVDPVGGDVHLLAASPAIDAAEELPVFEDFDGTTRPFGTAPDIGAFEYSGGLIFADGFESASTARWDASVP
jgi:PKD repeat protein